MSRPQSMPGALGEPLDSSRRPNLNTSSKAASFSFGGTRGLVVSTFHGANAAIFRSIEAVRAEVQLLRARFALEACVWSAS